jgi:uncharacterized RDD family membrane protein YckC
MFCLSCGTSNDSLDRFCANCGASRVALQTVSTGGGTMAQPLPAGNSAPRIASLGRRIIAVILDFIVVWSLISVIVVLVPPRMLEDSFSLKGPAALIPIGLCTLGLLYYVLLEALFGATPGKGIAGIQVRRRDDEDCNFRASLIRNLLRVVDALVVYLVGFLVAVFSESRQRIGDLVAGTIVVRRPATAFVRVMLVLALFGLAGSGFVACQVIPRR